MKKKKNARPPRPPIDLKRKVRKLQSELRKVKSAHWDIEELLQVRSVAERELKEVERHLSNYIGRPVPSRMVGWLLRSTLLEAKEANQLLKIMRNYDSLREVAEAALPFMPAGSVILDKVTSALSGVPKGASPAAMRAALATAEDVLDGVARYLDEKAPIELVLAIQKARAQARGAIFTESKS